MIRLIVFDLGRVLIRICDDWRHACAVAGVPAPSAPIDQSTAARLMAAVCESETGRIDLDGFARAASPLLGIDIDHVRKLSDAYLLDPFPGVIELLDELKAAGYSTACLSNTNVNHWRLLHDPSSARHEVMRRLDACFASHLIGARKPDPITFEHVERATAFAREQIVFFDDLSENIAAARERGWFTCWIDPKHDPVPQMRTNLRSHGVLT